MPLREFQCFNVMLDKQNGNGSEDNEPDEDLWFNDNGSEIQFAVVELPRIRKEVECPICLGILRETRAVKECMHRFCKECIEKYISLGNHKCPSCRGNCPSLDSLRADTSIDTIISSLYTYSQYHHWIQRTIYGSLKREAEEKIRKESLERSSAVEAIVADVPLRGRRKVRRHESSDEDEGNDASSSVVGRVTFF